MSEETNQDADWDLISRDLEYVRQFQAGELSGRELLAAASAGDLQRVREIVDAPASSGGLILLRMIAADSNGNSPLHLAAMNGHRTVVEFLFDKGLSMNATNSNAETPAHLAERNGFDALAELLRSKESHA